MPCLMYFVLYIFLIATVRGSKANSQGSFSASYSRQVSPSVFTCDTSDPTVKLICTAALTKLNSELKEAGVSIHRDGVLFTYDDPKDERIRTGHSCSVTAQVRHKHFSAKLSSSTDLDLSGDSLTEPLAIRLTLPVSVHGRVDVKQRFGGRVFGKCVKYGSDSYSLKAHASATANIVVGLSLNPSLGMVASGDFALVIRPQVAALFSLDDTRLNFRASDVSPISAALTFVTGLSSTLFKSVTALFKGDSVSTILKSSLPFDIGAPILLGVGALPGPLERAVWEVLTDYGKHSAEKKAAGLGVDLEDKLNREVRRALKTDSCGKRTFIIPKEIVQIVAAGKNAAESFSNVPVDPSVACRTSAGSLCNSCRGCLDCYKAMEACSKLASKYNSQYGISGLVASRPKIAIQKAAVSPTPRPRNISASRRERCIEEANQLCSSCRGCAECGRRQVACRNS